MSIEFLSPLAGLVALLGLVPLAAFVDVRMRARRGRRAIGLPEPPRRARLVPLAALVAAAACLGLAAMQPVASLEETRRVRTDVEALVVLDTTRSMLASATPRSPSRMDRAKGVATALHARLPTVPVGLASLTDRTLPHLFPSADGEVFRATLEKAIGVERPPPVHTFSNRVTNLEALSAVVTQGFFSPTISRRVLVVVTDGESLPGTRARLGPVFRRPPGIETVFVQVWDRDERVFRRQLPEPGYRPDPGAREALDRLAAEIDGEVFEEDELAGAATRLPQLVGSGPSVVQGERRRDIPLAPYLAAFAFVPIVLVLWRRDR
ncbi:MAG: vWA domain-containing protein [Gaiellaceae bacterium]